MMCQDLKWNLRVSYKKQEIHALNYRNHHPTGLIVLDGGWQTFIRFSMISRLFTATSTTIQRLKRPAWLCHEMSTDG